MRIYLWIVLCSFILLPFHIAKGDDSCQARRSQITFKSYQKATLSFELDRNRYQMELQGLSGPLRSGLALLEGEMAVSSRSIEAIGWTLRNLYIHLKMESHQLKQCLGQSYDQQSVDSAMHCLAQSTSQWSLLSMAFVQSLIKTGEFFISTSSEVIFENLTDASRNSEAPLAYFGMNRLAIVFYPLPSFFAFIHSSLSFTSHLLVESASAFVDRSGLLACHALSTPPLLFNDSPLTFAKANILGGVEIILNSIQQWFQKVVFKPWKSFKNQNSFSLKDEDSKT